MRIRALGGLSVVRDQSLVVLEGDAADLLRCLICLRGRPLPAHELCTYLWPSDRLGGIPRLRAANAALRAATAPAAPSDPLPVIGVRGGLELHPYATWIDLDDFEDAAVTGHELLLEGERATARTWLRAAESLYVGDLLAGEPETGWLRRERRRVRAIAEEVALRLDHPLPALAA